MSAEEKDGADLQQEEFDPFNVSAPEEEGLRIWPVVRRKNPYVPQCQSWNWRLWSENLKLTAVEQELEVEKLWRVSWA